MRLLSVFPAAIAAWALLSLISFVAAPGHYDHTFPRLREGVGERNLAAIGEGVRVQASSSQGFGGASPAVYALDGDPGFGWMPDGRDTRPWLRVTFRAPHRISSLRVSASHGLAEATCILHAKEVQHLDVPAGELVPFAAERCDAVEWRFRNLLPCVRGPSELGGAVCTSRLVVSELEALGQ